MPARDTTHPTTATAATQLGFEALGTPLIDTTFAVLDLETTGLAPARDRITEVGIVKVRGGEVLGELRTLVHPGRPVPPGITAVTGITDAMVAGAPRIDVLLPTILRFLEGTVLVAHNAPFDVAFLRAAIDAHLGERFDPVTVDTARLSRRLLRDEVRDHRLATLATHLRARTQPAHRALADARATVDVLHGLIERAGTLGATTLEDLRVLARSSSDVAVRRLALVRDAPSTCGVYRFLDARGDPLYIGKATDLRARLRTYFGQDRRRRIADLVRDTAEVTWTPTDTLLAAEVLEVRELHAHRPRDNRRSTTPERSVHIAVTREAFPRLSIVAAPGAGHRTTVGPFTSRRVAAEVIEALQATTAVRACTLRLRRAQDHAPCILKDLGRCGAPCDGSQDHAAYAAVVADLEAALDDPTGVLEDLRTRMAALAAAGRFEQAGEVRMRLHTAATALSAVRRRAALATVDELIVAARSGDGTDVAVVRRGRLAGTCRLDAGATDHDVLVAVAAIALEPHEGPPARDDAEEVGLVLRWLGGPDRRVVAATGAYQEPVAGSAALDAVSREARQVARRVRQDRQLLRDDKVRHRHTDDLGAATAATG